MSMTDTGPDLKRVTGAIDRSISKERENGVWERENKRTRHHRQHRYTMLNVHENEHTAPPKHHHGNHHGRVPIEIITTPRNRDKQQQQGRTPEKYASVVNPLHHRLHIRPGLMHRRRQHEHAQHSANRRNRTQQPKEPTPRTLLHKSRCDKRPRHVADANTRPNHTLPLPPLFQRNDIRHNHGGERHDAPVRHAG